MDKETRHALEFLANAIINKGILPTADMNILNEMACGDFSSFEQDEQEESRPVLDMNGSLRRIPVLINGTKYYAYVSSITQKKAGMNIAGTDLFTAKIELTAPYVPFIPR